MRSNKQQLKDNLILLNDYVIDFLEYKYIDYLETINYNEYSEYYVLIYTHLLDNFDLKIFEFIQNKIIFDDKIFTCCITQVLPRITEKCLDYLIKNFHAELITSLNKYFYLVELILFENTLEVLIKIDNFINDNAVTKNIKNNIRYNDHRKYKDIRNVAWIHHKLNKITTSVILSNINFINLSLIEFKNIMTLFTITDQNIISMLSKNSRTFYDICKSGNTEIMEYIILISDAKLFTPLNINKIFEHICASRNLEFIKVMYYFLSALSYVISTQVLTQCVTSLTFARHNKQQNEIILALIDLGANSPKGNARYAHYASCIVK